MINAIAQIGNIVGDVMTSGVLTTSLQTNIEEIVRIIDEKKIRRLPVVDEKNKLAGIISPADILKTAPRKHELPTCAAHPEPGGSAERHRTGKLERGQAISNNFG
jgi:CBS-domain-containing membrane protein